MQEARLGYLEELESIKSRSMYSDGYKAKLISDAKAARNAVLLAEAEKVKNSAHELRNPAEVAVLDVTDANLMNALGMIDLLGDNLTEQDMQGIVQQFRTDAPALRAIGAKLRKTAAAVNDAMKAAAIVASAKEAETYAAPVSDTVLEEVERMAFSVLFNPDNFTTIDEWTGYTLGEIAVNRLMREAERTGYNLDMDPDLQSWDENKKALREEQEEKDLFYQALKRNELRKEGDFRKVVQRYIDIDQEHAGDYARYADEQLAARPGEELDIETEVHDMWRGWNMNEAAAE